MTSSRPQTQVRSAERTRPWAGRLTGRFGVALLAIGFAIAYFVISRVSLTLVDGDSSVAVLWPASGLALAVVVKAPRRIWPVLFGSVLVGNLVAQTLGRGSSVPPPSASRWSTPPSRCWPLPSCSGWCATGPSFAVGSVRGVGGLVAAATLANGVTATVGALVLAIGVGCSVHEAFGDWWLADGLGMLSVAPPILARWRVSAAVAVVARACCWSA